MRKQNLIWVMIVFLLPILACGLFGGGGGEAGLEADVSAPTAAEAPTKEAVVEEVETVKEEEKAEEAAESESVKFTGVANLDQLSTYRVSFVMDFDGQSGGQPAKGHIEMTLEQSKDPPARHLAMSMAGTTVEEMGGTNAMDVYIMGDTVYMKNAAMGDSWVSFSGSDADAFEQGFFAPDEQLELPDTVTCASQPETVNGISATHCSFTEKDMVSDEVAYDSVQGDVWIAVDGNYIIKYTLKADGYRSLKEDEEGLFDFGSVSFGYELKDVNGDFTITLPEEATQAGGIDVGGAGGAVGTSDLPVLENAEEVTAMAGFLNYYTSSDISTIIDFYRQELPAIGWQENADQAYVGDDNAMLSFTKEGQTMMLTIVKEDNRTNVIITTQ
jgi:hypothetical protein